MQPKINTFSSKGLRMLLNFKNKAKKRYVGWKSQDSKKEYVLLKKVYKRLHKLQCNQKKREEWYTKSLKYLQMFVQKLIKKTENQRLIFRTTRDRFAELKYFGLKSATSNCLLVHARMKNENDRFLFWNNFVIHSLFILLRKIL